jgi:cytochrome c oxidase assembly protein subunit 11
MLCRSAFQRLRATISRYGTEKRKETSNLNTFLYGSSAAIFFGGLCYAAVPLYRIFCSATGFAGTPKTGHYALDPKKLDGLSAHNGREVKVRFVSNTARSMPWEFTPQVRHVTVHPGQSALAFYRAFNPTDREIIGMSTYNIVPPKAAPYFNKIQCFCFEEQRLGPQEEVEMPVFFYIDPDFAKDPAMGSVDEIILSYTFFDTSKDNT